jgi:rhamnosyltransferase
MDQDSVWEDFPFYLHETVFNEKAPKGIWGPNAYCATVVEIIHSDYIITSGMLLQVELISKIGGWDEAFSIDCVDDEFCLRAKRVGISTYFWGACRLNQRYGSPEKAKLFGRTFNIELKNYSASRLYSIFRNHIILIRKFPEVSFLKKDFNYNWIQYIKWVAIFEKNRKKKLYSIIKGIIDGYRFQLPA